MSYVTETHGQNTLQAVQLEDRTTAYIQHTVQMPQSNTILTTHAGSTVSDFNDGTIDQETISVLEQYASKVVSRGSFTLLRMVVWQFIQILTCGLDMRLLHSKRRILLSFLPFR